MSVEVLFFDFKELEEDCLNNDLRSLDIDKILLQQLIVKVIINNLFMIFPINLINFSIFIYKVTYYRENINFTT